MDQQSALILLGLTISLIGLSLSFIAIRLRKRKKNSQLMMGQAAFSKNLSGLGALWSQKTENIFAQLEEILLSSDVGIQSTQIILEKLAERKQIKNLKTGEDFKVELKTILEELLNFPQSQVKESKPCVMMVVGVNGVGKTTSIGKLAHHLKSQNKKVLLGAADTFRAGAIAQLQHWGEENDCPVLAQKEGADPGAVAFDSVKSGIAKEMDSIIVDTAGRLQSKQNLMEELKKVKRVMAKALPECPHEIILVLDANTGQNALSQAIEFHKTLGLTGIILTKWDGTAKGGSLLGISQALQVPIKFLGIGEQKEDLIPFDANKYIDALIEN